MQASQWSWHCCTSVIHRLEHLKCNRCNIVCERTYMINSILAWCIQQQKELSQLCSRLKERWLRFHRKRSFSCDTTDDDCNGGDLLTVFNYVMDAESIDCDVDYPESSNGGCGGSGLLRRWTSSEMRRTRGVDEVFISIRLQVRPSQFTIWKWIWNWKICTCAGGAFFSAYHSRSQVVQFQQGTRDDQQSHYSPEGGGLGGCRTQRLCDTELTTTTQTRKEKTATVEKFHDTVDELDASMENLAMEVTKLQVSHQVEVHEGPRFVVRQSRDTDWETSFSDVPELVVVRILLCTIQNSSSRPLKLRATAGTSGNCGRRSMIWRRHLNCFQTTCRLVDKLGFEKCP